MCRVFAACRILHTIVYLLVIPQVLLLIFVVVIFLLLLFTLFLTFLPSLPARALAFFGGVGVNLYMAYQIITAFM